MQGDTYTSLPLRLVLLALGAFLAISPASAQVTETVLNDFTGASGSQVFSGLTFDSSGNLYGTTASGGLGSGTVYELSPAVGGGWTETVLYKFGSKSGDGADPYGGVVFDATGHLYGTTKVGGTHSKGTLYRLTHLSGGGWSESVLHNFGGGKDGANPLATPVIDPAGNLYGTTYYGGTNVNCTAAGKTYSCGTVYELSSAGVYGVIHDFSSVSDGYFPVAGITPDSSGNLYGQTTYGGIYGGGLLFELSPSNGTWTEAAIHPWGRVNDGRPDGAQCYGTLVFDNSGHMWGTSLVGGTHGDMGTVFKFTKNGPGWAESSVHGFGEPGDGASPYSGLVVDSEGNLFGTTTLGGASGEGTVYEIIPLETGYDYELLYSFTGLTDGRMAAAPMILDGLGNLYGTTMWGGDSAHCTKSEGCGVVFEISGATD
jgi:uncharacterized repeat protein (TIGR03803 family)